MLIIKLGMSRGGVGKFTRCDDRLFVRKKRVSRESDFIGEKEFT